MLHRQARSTPSSWRAHSLSEYPLFKERVALCFIARRVSHRVHGAGRGPARRGALHRPGLIIIIIIIIIIMYNNNYNNNNNNK